MSNTCLGNALPSDQTVRARLTPSASSSPRSESWPAGRPRAWKSRDATLRCSASLGSSSAAEGAEQLLSLRARRCLVRAAAREAGDRRCCRERRRGRLAARDGEVPHLAALLARLVLVRAIGRLVVAQATLEARGLLAARGPEVAHLACAGRRDVASRVKAHARGDSGTGSGIGSGAPRGQADTRSSPQLSQVLSLCGQSALRSSAAHASRAKQTTDWSAAHLLRREPRRRSARRETYAARRIRSMRRRP
jgi:hypothetical protein